MRLQNVIPRYQQVGSRYPLPMDTKIHYAQVPYAKWHRVMYTVGPLHPDSQLQIENTVSNPWLTVKRKPVGMESRLCVHINDLFQVVTLVAYTLFDTYIAIIQITFKITFSSCFLGLHRKLQLVL